MSRFINLSTTSLIIFVGIDGAAPPEYLNIEFTVRPAATYGINSQLKIIFSI